MRKNEQSNYWVWAEHNEIPYKSVLASTPQEAIKKAGEYGKKAYRVDDKTKFKNYPALDGVVKE
jgi:hypothetical protein